uniref:Aminotransferase-like plant mobile domain-containing protein n=1 Tax=Oryza glumipatula TaxID=40148 RepID=A0A0E0AIW4_9ORYZ
MAVEIAQGSHRAIGITSMAFLYCALDNIYHYVAARKALASDCSLSVPGHFIMGWFASFWNEVQMTTSLACPTINQEFGLFDNRALHVQWVISMAAVDLFVSCTVGSVTYKRGDHFGNQLTRFRDINTAPKNSAPATQTSVDPGVSKGTPTQQQKLAERRALKLRSRPHRHHPPQAQSLHRSCEARIKTVGKNIEEIRACIAHSDNVATIASFQASQQELLALSPRSETYSEGLAIPRAPDDIGTPPIDLFASEFPDIAALLDGGADPETGLYLDSPIFPDATQEDHVDSHLPENNEACTEANPDTGREETTLTGAEKLSSESKKLSMEIEYIKHKSHKHRTGTLMQGKAPNVVSAHGLKHVWSEIFQELLKQCPVQKDIVLKETSINLDLWSNFFSKPPPEIIRLMEGLRVLKGALSEEVPLPTTNLILAQQDQINQHVDMLRTT